jgi:hypothetical protein
MTPYKVVKQKAWSEVVLVLKASCFSAQFLCCVARGLPVVSPAWIAESRKAGLFLDPWTFLLRDEANEKKLGFKLEATLHQVSGHRVSKPGLVISSLFSDFKGWLVVFCFKGWLVVFLISRGCCLFSISRDGWLFFLFQGMPGCFSHFTGWLDVLYYGWFFFSFQWMAGCFSHFKGLLVVFLISRDCWLFFSFQWIAGCFSHFKE